MAPRLQNLSVDSEDGQELISSIENGDVPADWTGQVHKKQRTELGRSMAMYTTASINSVLNNYRRKLRSSLNGMCLDTPILQVLTMISFMQK